MAGTSEICAAYGEDILRATGTMCTRALLPRASCMPRRRPEPEIPCYIASNNLIPWPRLWRWRWLSYSGGGGGGGAGGVGVGVS